MNTNVAASTMTMAMARTSSTSTAVMTTTSTMTMNMEMGGSCKVSMLWNWYTIDSCFVTSSWHIRSHAMFAGSCIGVILLVMSLELLRRLGKEYDRYILRQHQRACTLNYPSHSAAASKLSESQSNDNTRPLIDTSPSMTFKPSAIQQAVRATIHMVQFTVAYFVMLLAMYFNEYIILCIVIGAWLGPFLFSWERMLALNRRKR